MTYLEAVNAVLTRLRERNVATVNQTTYSALIGAMVNDAYRQIAMAWDWSQLRQILTVTTSLVDELDESLGYNKEYEIEGAGEDFEILTSWNNTSNVELVYEPQPRFDDRNYTSPSVTGIPNRYTIRGVSNNNTKIEVYPTPDGVYDLKFNGVVNISSLTAESDVLAIPEWPVVHQALFMAARERGEVGGQMAMEFYMTAKEELANAIAKDAAKHPDELVYQSHYHYKNNTGAFS